MCTHVCAPRNTRSTQTVPGISGNDVAFAAELECQANVQVIIHGPRFPSSCFSCFVKVVIKVVITNCRQFVFVNSAEVEVMLSSSTESIFSYNEIFLGPSLLN